MLLTTDRPRILESIPPEIRPAFQKAAKELALGKVDAFSRWKYLPVDPHTFFTHEYYLNSGGSIYPPVMVELVKINSGEYDEIVLTGGIGAAKTSIAVWSQAYQLYLLSCLKEPQSSFGLDPTHEIVVIFQSLNARLAQELDFARFKAVIERSKYFQEQFPHNRYLEAQLEFPNRLVVKPVSGNETAAIGQNVIGGVIDEVNFMAVVENSKLASDGGTYDQAVELYNTIARRRKSRFMSNGRMPGLLCLVSSKKTPGQFTDVKEEEAKTNPRIYVYNKRVWDIKPDSFCGDTFRVFCGDDTRKPRLMYDGEQLPLKDVHLIDSIPIEFAQEFKDDLTKALRDIAGKSTLAIHPFMPDAERVTQNFGKRRSVLAQQMVDFQDVKPTLYPAHIENKQFRRFAHLDLALTGDSAGMVIGHCQGFRQVKRGEAVEVLPIIAIDCALEVMPPPSGEIEFSNLRRILYKLREMGLPIHWVTLDSYQSVDTMQILRSEGFITGYQSMDTSMVPYQILKTALYDGRVPMPPHQKLQKELLTLERDFKRGKIDHNAHGSKDIADALAGVVYGLSMRRETWSNFDVSPSQSPSMFQEIQVPKENEAGNDQQSRVRRGAPR